LLQIRIPKNTLDPRKTEQESVGQCVREDDDECARSTDTEEQLEAKQTVSCRPGLLGILAEALYCQQIPQTASNASNDQQCRSSSNSGQAAAPLGGPRHPGPTLLDVLLDAGPKRRRNRLPENTH
jgi:hypothetical protein